MNPFLSEWLPVSYLNLDFYDINLAFTELGTGEETLIFIHGLGHSRLAWMKNLNELSKYYHCIAIDLPGYGQSSDSLSYPYGMGFYAEVIFHLIQELGLKKVSLVGHSMGGQIAITFALNYPKLLKSLVLCASAGFEVFQPWEKVFFRSAMMFMDFVVDEEQSLNQVIESSFYEMPNSAHNYLKKLVEQMRQKDKKRYRKIMEQSISGMLDEPVFNRLSEIICPVQILFGNRDGFIPNRLIHPVSTKVIAENAVEKILDAHLEMIPFCGHFLQWEKSEVVNSIIKEFLR